MYVDVAVPLPLDGTFTYSIPAEMESFPGRRVRVPFGGRSLIGWPVTFHDNKPEGFTVKEIGEVVDQQPVFGEGTIRLARFLSDTWLSSLGEALSAALPSGTSPTSRYRLPFKVEPREMPGLTDEQQLVVDDILSQGDRGQRSHLLHGITGSGKTEVYMNLARAVMDQGRSVLFLVPEISLSSQIFQRLYAVFGDELVIYHSHLTKNQRLFHWMRFYSGDARIAIGTRSSVFMQAPDLGLIIMDEEHDSSYKEHSTPRYNARQVAFFRSREENALLVLGSATPSIETYYAAEKGIVQKHVLAQRYGGASLPQVEVVHMETARDEKIISPRLRLHVSRAVEKKQQSILFLNRRGFSPMVICESCSQVITCPHCSISMNFHSQGTLLCHYCGYTMVMPESCPQCGSSEMVKVGTGTQKVEGMVSTVFPAAVVHRVDQDSVRKKEAMYNLVEKMETGEIDILLGTQMISKGFDFSKVTIVGVLLADIGLNIPDFRSQERIFSLLMQVAGRSGRGDEPGRVIIQTLDSERPLFDFVVNHDYHGFYQSEIAARKLLGYPPFTRLARLLVRGKDQDKVKGVMEHISSRVRSLVDKARAPVTILGPVEAPLSRIAGQYRYHLVLKSSTLEPVRHIIRKIKEEPVDRGLYLEIDIDPYELL